MKELVTIENGIVVCDSQTVAEKFCKNHFHVLRDIDNLRSGLAEIVHPRLDALVFIEKSRVYRGREFRFIEMNRQAFSLLVMRFTGKEALHWQFIFNDAFYAMEERLLLSERNKKDEGWLTQRSQGKLVRHEETDAIKEFLDYVRKQNPNSNYLRDGIGYASITRMSYKCLGFIQYGKKDIRNLLDTLELAHLVSAELTVAASLRKYMSLGESYKNVIRYTEKDLFALVELLGTKRRQLPASEVKVVSPKQLTD